MFSRPAAEKAKNRLLTRAAQKRDCVFAGGYRAATVRERTASAALALIALSGMSHGCARQPAASFERIAIIPFENLTADPDLDWIGRAVANIVASQISGPRVHAAEIAAPTDPAGRRATRLVRGYFEQRGANLRFSAVVRDAATERTLSSYSAEGGPGALLPAGASLARQIGPDARPYSTSSEKAVRLLFEDKPREALAEDPTFAQAYIAWIQKLRRAGDTEGIKHALSLARAHEMRMSKADRARICLLRATVEADHAERALALRDWIEVNPGDADALRQLAEIELLRKDFSSAARAYDRALEIEPDDVALWNRLGYARAYAGDLSGAIKALERYREIAPADANSLDSLGEVHFMHGKFAQAERYFLEAYAKNPSIVGGGELFRAAVARALGGDRAGAKALFGKYLSSRGSDPLRDMREALFLYITGEREAAESALQKLENPLAKAQLAVWTAARHNLAEARVLAEQAAKSARTPQSRAAVAILAATVAANVPPNLPKQLQAYRLLFQKSPEAVEVWKEIYDSTTGIGSSDVKVMYLWAKLLAGQPPEPNQLYPLPPHHPEPGLGTLSMPKFLELRGATPAPRAAAERPYRAPRPDRTCAGRPSSRAKCCTS